MDEATASTSTCSKSVQTEPAVPSVKTVHIVAPSSQPSSKKKKVRATRSDAEQTPMVYGFWLDNATMAKLGHKLEPLPPGTADTNEAMQSRSWVAYMHIRSKALKLTHLWKISVAKVEVESDPNGSYHYEPADRIKFLGRDRALLRIIPGLTREKRGCDLVYSPSNWEFRNWEWPRNNVLRHGHHSRFRLAGFHWAFLLVSHGIPPNTVIHIFLVLLAFFTRI
ncbi:hypothetical protein BDZ97DRAFT_1384095 [Flammula alnicola]|nr:hypothetical protein BDZ97DRAFT_1384095 [Flammula alnicola]